MNICIDCLIKVRGKVILWLKHLSQNFLRVKGHFSGTCRPIADQWTDINFTKTSIEKDGHSPGEFYRRKHNTWYADMYFLQFIVSKKVETQSVTLDGTYVWAYGKIQIRTYLIEILFRNLELKQQDKWLIKLAKSLQLANFASPERLGKKFCCGKLGYRCIEQYLYFFNISM